MKAVVDDCLFSRPLGVVVYHCHQRVTLVLGSEGNDGGGAAESGRDARAVEIIGAHHAHRRKLLDMAMAIHAARQHQVSSRIEVAPARRQINFHRNDATVSNANVAAHRIACSGHRAIAHGEIEFMGHGTPAWSWSVNCPRIGIDMRNLKACNVRFGTERSGMARRSAPSVNWQMRRRTEARAGPLASCGNAAIGVEPHLATEPDSIEFGRYRPLDL